MKIYSGFDLAHLLMHTVPARTLRIIPAPTLQIIPAPPLQIIPACLEKLFLVRSCTYILKHTIPLCTQLGFFIRLLVGTTSDLVLSTITCQDKTLQLFRTRTGSHLAKFSHPDPVLKNILRPGPCNYSGLALDLTLQNFRIWTRS